MFAEIRRARPDRLLVVADGPRPDRPGEAECCAAARKITEAVDWPCQVDRNYSPTNLGCRRRVSSGLSWVFESVSEAIILEDDCLPHPGFFDYCDVLLARYRETPEVFSICGTNLLRRHPRPSESYYFSRYPMIWGWATWRRVWSGYDVDIKSWPELRDSGWPARILGSTDVAAFFSAQFESIRAGTSDTWDTQLLFASMQASGLSILPSTNLISNIGFGRAATHTTVNDHPLASQPLEDPDRPLRHPSAVIRDEARDQILEQKFYLNPPKNSFSKRVVRKLRCLLSGGY